MLHKEISISHSHDMCCTTTVEEVDSMLPMLRDLDGHVYIREWSGGIMAGGFEPISKPIFSDGVPSPFEFELLPEDWDHFH